MLFVTVVSVSVIPAATFVTIGTTVQFQCVAISTVSNTSLIFSWEHPSNADVVINMSYLTVVVNSTESEGEYTCSVISTESGTNSSAIGSVRIGMSDFHFVYSIIEVKVRRSCL